MHRLTASFILAYHGCDRKVARDLVEGKPFSRSENGYDWLGDGVYFWEANPKRALAFAFEKANWEKASGRTRTIREPSLVGALIDLGRCLDLTTKIGIDQVGIAYEFFAGDRAERGVSLPINRVGRELLLRELDCAVIETLHWLYSEEGRSGADTVRGVFFEGKPLYDTSGFRSKTHIQVCVRTEDCIKAVFNVPASDLL